MNTVHSVPACRITVQLSALFLICTALGVEAPSTFKVGEFSFTRPVSWEWVEVTSSMRKAQLRVPDPEKKASADIIFFYFGEGNGGGTKPNIDRWFRQFQEPKERINAKVEEATIGQRKVTYVQAEGTYLSGMPGGPQTPLPNHALIGAIIESAQGNVFIRMTGPASLAKSTLNDFKKFVEMALK
ncbi:MAG: hypothetical protein ABI651_03960 [Verrucomicrobiota bacterium]